MRAAARLDSTSRRPSLLQEAINTILTALPRDRNTYLFSATMTSKVAKLQRASLRDPVRVEVSSKYSTVKTLVQVGVRRSQANYL